jgi:hypothetical protein
MLVLNISRGYVVPTRADVSIGFSLVINGKIVEAIRSRSNKLEVKG